MARFDDLPIEIVEQVALELSQLPPEPSRYGGLAIRNPVTGRAFSSSKDPLLNFSKVSRDCRMACVRYFPSLVHTIHATSFGDLHQLRQDYNARTRVAPYVKHIVLDFQVPLLDVRALKLGMSVLCQVPGMVSLPHLAGLSFSSRFIHSFYGHINHQRVSRQYRQLAEEMGNWQGSLLAGIAGLGSVVTRGGQSLGKFGDAEVLFLKGTWTQEQGEVLMVSGNICALLAGTGRG